MSISESLLGLIRLAPRFLFAIAVLGWTVLLMREEVAANFGVSSLRDSHRPWVGLATLGASALLLAHGMAHLLGNISQWFRRRATREATLRELRMLSRDELAVLAYFVFTGAPTQYLILNFPAARALESKGLLIATPGSGDWFQWPYTIPDFVWQEIHVIRDQLFSLTEEEANHFVRDFPRIMHDRSVLGNLL